MESHSDAERGYVYILGVKDIELPVCKIGRTSRDPVVRCAEINQSSTGDFLWEVIYQIAVSDHRKFESLVHTRLLPLRQRRREFFNIYPDDAILAVQSILASAPDIHAVTITEAQKAGIGLTRTGTHLRKQSMRTNGDTLYANLLASFTELLGVKGRVFGQLNKPVFGISDGHEGVQWNLAIYPDNGKARVGVNLEGLQYNGWPIATLIKSELKAPKLLKLVPDLLDPQEITLRFARDAWQQSSRPRILEETLGGREFRLSEITDGLWHSILTEAIDCLNKDRSYHGRARQAVTRVRKGGPDTDSTLMWVSPHLTIWTPIDPLSGSIEALSAAIDRLKPVHEWASKVSGEQR
ncbi:GIY-YIG nuclease family protein [Pseudomonas aeruginosa]|uniref:GIY-YIG nuclease family protein n=1 Tax=Pseudomonas aeruginosa TaxID=287 RepID=UPI000FC41927|nr:GIY-YIG nuclease family protein [Pseudomonas aeruginosa]RUI22464.1 GIY-YIG nuclease family protein [Pseudomonas aeruginosa]